MTAGSTDDRAALGQLMGQFLSAVTFSAGERPAYDVLRELFIEDGKLIRTSEDVPEVWTLDDFIRPRQETVDSGALTSFSEIEVGHVTEVFGNVAHRFSTYEKHGTLDGVTFGARGAISTQFIRTADGWRMASMAWDDERPGLLLPSLAR